MIPSKNCETFRIIDIPSGDVQGVYSRAYHAEFDFASPEEARSANVNGIYQDRTQYRIDRYRVTFELIEEDV